MKVASPELSVNPEIVEFTGDDDRVNVFVPVLNDGADGIVGSGKNSDPSNDPALSAVSYTHLTLPTTG